MERGGRSGWFVGLGVGLLLGLAPAAMAQGSDDSDPAGAYEEYDELYFEEDGDASDATGDPLEPVNRSIFSFNDGLDRYVLGPVSDAWDFVLPDFAQRSLRRAFDNLRFPVQFVNHLLQAKPVDAGVDVARFVLNTTIGVVGLMDPASAIGLHERREDFGQTLGYWGVPQGPYLMVPFIGPSTVRDGTGLIVDSGLRGVGFFLPIWASAGMTSLDGLNRRSLVGDVIEAEREAALDWYSAVRSAYLQQRESLVHDRRDTTDTEYDLFPTIEPGTPGGGGNDAKP